MSIATLLSQHHHVTAVDIISEKVEMINNRKSPIQDDYIEKYLAEKELDLAATLDAKAAYSDADFVVIAAPTNYDSHTQHFDTSAVEAAEQYDGKVIGVDVDQRPKIGDLCITSAMKGLGSAVNSALDAYFGGNWASIGGKSEQLGLAQGDYLGLPTDTDSWGFTTFTVDEYNTVLDGLKDGSITVSNDTENQPEVGSHVTVDYVE